ncbi:hypothetical protein KUTeg_020605 [Tegillarca granosa]|uniref:Caveolin n=1 Tax=Tegillarca granosa TaxID=220873 RepID=A0ABQ9EED7_TEGGR|nr:hypothetical protein KUTeg_020605 [Tegillarca granosa]
MVKVDLEERDKNGINSHIKVYFEDVLAEPNGTHSYDGCWETSEFCYNFGLQCCYLTMTSVCGIFIALYWGCEFAIVAFQHVWCGTPILRTINIYTGCLQKCLGTCIACVLAPIMDSCGYLFSSISVKHL